MKMRRRRVPLLILLLPSLVVTLVSAKQDMTIPSLQQIGEPRKPDVEYPSPVSYAVRPSTKASLGTKDAPVDGKDGKPHAGPWVDDDKDRKKSKPSNEDGELITGKRLSSSGLLQDADIPESNDGVMDDRMRELPKDGTTGTEGGISEKDKARKAKEGQTGAKVENKPASPKEAPPLPHSEQERILELQEAAAKAEKEGKKGKGKEKSANKDKDVEKGKGVQKDQVKSKDKGNEADPKLGSQPESEGLEKSKDLPSSPHDTTQSRPESVTKEHIVATPKQSTPNKIYDEVTNGLIQPLHSFVLSLAMILVSEIGDKTFLIAALMAMKHDRIVVFSAAFSALITMTILSAVLGHALPTLLPQRLTNLAAAILFLIFGAKLLREGLAMSPSEGVATEMQEVEMELEEKEQRAREQGRSRSSISPYSLEMGLAPNMRKSRSGTRIPSPARSPSSSRDTSPTSSGSRIQRTISGLGNLLSLLLSPAWVQTFVMTFLGEWGDRSQIATIAMAAGQDYWWVTGGAISGHAVCTGMAVIGGRAIAGRVSMRVVTLGGSVAFVIFGIIYLIEAVYYA